jgi:hypothetical protein
MRMIAKPIQIYLKPEQDQALRHLAKRLGISIAELIRRSVDMYLHSLPVEDDPALRLVGLGRSGRHDLSADHDRVLAQAGRP